MNPIFHKITSYLTANDHYHTQHKNLKIAKTDYSPISIVQSIQIILKMYEHITAIGTNDRMSDFEESMQNFIQ